MLKISNTQLTLLRLREGNFNNPVVLYENKLASLRRRRGLYGEEIS